jgi:Na+-transporting NADH:ubiquinone oxidoreductase subunit NqrB
MGVIQRGIIFSIGTVANGIIFIFLSRVVLPLVNTGPTGPATQAMQLLPAAMQLAIGGLQVGLIFYFISGLGEERATQRRPMR